MGGANMTGTLARIVAPHFVAGLILNEAERVTHAAPILRYMVGWTAPRVRAFVALKGWTATRYRHDPNAPRAILHSAAAVAATQGTTMQQWPEQTTPDTPEENPDRDAPGAPHTPQAPRETPEPRDPDRDSESE